jgi:hypothetical protein
MPKQAMNYQNTVIYKIVCNDLNIKDCYVGHTTNFTKRKCAHKKCCKNANISNMKVYSFITANGGWDNWNMLEIEKHPCNDINEALKRERHFYEELKATLNVRVPSRSASEYRCDNDDKIKLYKKNYQIINKERIQIKKTKFYNENKNKINLKQKMEYNCDCGSIIRISDKARHFRCQKHIKFISNKL